MSPSGQIQKNRVILHIDMDAFFAAVEQRDNPALQGKPVIIGADPKGGKGRGVVSTCSYEARPYGVHSAMPISRAYRLCPHGIYLRGDHKKYRDVSRQVFGILADFTPDIQPVSIDEAFLDMTGAFHFYGTPLKAGAAIKKRIRDELCLNASIGIAPNKMVAKIASDTSKPDGLLEVQDDNMLVFLWALPVEKIWGVGAQTQKSLNLKGIHTIGDLARMPLALLQKHYGKHGGHLYQLAHGIDDREVVIDDEIKSVSHEHTFESDTENRDEVRQALSLLSEKVSRRLRKNGLKGRTVTIKIRTADFRTVTRAHTLAERFNFFDTIFKEAWTMFNDFYGPCMRIRLIGVRVSGFEDDYAADSLFEDAADSRKENVHRAVDLIKDKFGEHSITRGRAE